MQERRRSPRQAGVWIGSCVVEGEPIERWRDCGVFDISTTGIGMDFRHPGGAGLVGHHISVRLPVGRSVDMTLTGAVRNIKAGPDGIVRVGIEFVGLSENELYIVDLLELGSMSASTV